MIENTTTVTMKKMKKKRSDLDRPIERHKFKKNGARVIFIPTDGELVYMEWVVHVGQFAETKRESYEMSHFCEHMLAKFTSVKYPNATSLATELAKYGIQTNAWTSEYETGYHMEGYKKHFNFMLEVLLNSISDFVLDETAFEQEKHAVEEELKGYLADPWFELAHTMDTILFPNHPVSVHMKEHLEHVAEITPDLMLSFKRRFYHPRRMMLVICGPIENRSQILSMCNKHFSSLQTSVATHSRLLCDGDTLKCEIFPNVMNTTTTVPSSSAMQQTTTTTTTARTKTGSKTGTKTTRTLVRIDNVFNAKILISWKVENLSKFDVEKTVVFDALAFILTDGFTSRLMHQLRTLDGLVYGIFANLSSSPFPGKPSTFDIETSCDVKSVDVVISKILDEINKLQTKSKPISEDEMETWRNSVMVAYARRALSLEPSSWANNYRSWLLWHKKCTNPLEHRRRLALDVTSEQIMEYSQLLTPSNMVVVVGHANL